MKKSLAFLFLSFIFFLKIEAQNTVPTFEEVISLPSVRNPKISPNGQHVLFQVGRTDWEENRFDTEIWLSKNGREAFPLTNNLKSSSNSPQWSPDGKWIAFLANKKEKTQIYIMRTEGGESFQLTNSKIGIQGFEWSPDGKQIAFTQTENKEKENKKRKEKYGAYSVEDQEYKMNRLWLMDFDPSEFARIKLPGEEKDSTFKSIHEPEILLDSVDYTVEDFEWSPDGKKIAFAHQPDPLINTFFKADISVLNLETKEVEILVDNPSYDGLVDWSPDGKSILYTSAVDNMESVYYSNTRLFKINIDGSNKIELAADFDEDLRSISWNEKGIFCTAYQKTIRHLFRIDPDDASCTVVLKTPARIFAYSFSKNGDDMAYLGNNDDSLNEIYKSPYPNFNAKKISHISENIKDWKTAQSEVVSWKSKDGATIEGILHKPQNYDLNKKYPLLVIIHGGPTGISVPGPAPSYVYPMLQWLDKGALILRPNYRGSAGYGADFRELNVKNLGVGDAWDVLSGVEYLENKGIIDGSKIASMGWSQGGYISAFLTTNSNKFKAICVGAGISNWMTYYVNTDIHPFTRQYLKATPWSDESIYKKTSPMTNINNASTPTLIQHGENDKRVPIANAYELFQGLQDVGVETKLIIYKGFGHGITKPKERLAAVWHNWQWFGKHIWGEEIEVPME